jgi:hypothetical protein
VSTKALHAAARRYLLDQREDVGNLLEEVERREPGDFSSVEVLRHWLLAVASRAEDDVRRPVETRGKGERIEVVRWCERTPEELAKSGRERDAFAAYIRGLGEAELRAVAPLPYRRVLSERQSARWRAKLAERWDARPREHYWYPLRPDPSPPDMLALQHLNFLLEVEPDAFRALFFQHGVTRAFEFVENHVFERDYELDLEWLVPSGVEVFWTARAVDWVVYVSHEHSITFAGDWLLAGIKAIWPNWQKRIYTDWSYAAHLGQDVLANSLWFRGPNHLPP